MPYTLILLYVQKNESKKMGVITVEVDPEKLREDSVIFQGEGRPLNSYQHAVNDPALKLCLDDPSLVKQRGKLVSLAREQVHNEGYQYKKKKSRSKAFGSSASQSTESPVAKKPRLSQELRSIRIHEVEEDLTELACQKKRIHADTRLRYLEKAREKFATVKQYEHAAEKSKKIMSLRGDKRKFQAEMAQLQKSEMKSKKYHDSSSKKASHSKQVEGDKSVNDPGQLKMMSFLEGSKQTGIVAEQVEEKETLVSDKHDDNSESSEDDVKEEDVGNLSAACSNDVPFLDEGQRHKSKMKN